MQERSYIQDEQMVVCTSNEFSYTLVLVPVEEAQSTFLSLFNLGYIYRALLNFCVHANTTITTSSLLHTMLYTSLYTPL